MVWRFCVVVVVASAAVVVEEAGVVVVVGTWSSTTSTHTCAHTYKCTLTKLLINVRAMFWIHLMPGGTADAIRVELVLSPTMTTNDNNNWNNNCNNIENYSNVWINNNGNWNKSKQRHATIHVECNNSSSNNNSNNNNSNNNNNNNNNNNSSSNNTFSNKNHSSAIRMNSVSPSQSNEWKSVRLESFPRDSYLGIFSNLTYNRKI